MSEAYESPKWKAFENKIVPFPQEIKTAEPGLLEYYFNILPEINRLYHYDRLPDEFSSNGIDLYLNWLADLTYADSRRT